MNWKSRYRQNKSAPLDKAARLPKATPVSGIYEIPDKATGDQAFRISVDVLRVTEQCTRSGDPCYFLSLQDGDGERFSVVVWASQWAILEGKVVEGKMATLDVRVPVGDYPAFTLAL